MIGETDNFLLYINITCFLVFVLFEIYSVIPGYFFFKKCFFEIGPFINATDLFFFNSSKLNSKHLLM